MREIVPVRQDSEYGCRRWFQDDYFDLFVWQDAAGEPIAFQLCYERATAEGVISWSAQAGFGHSHVDAGAQRTPLRYGMSPMLRPNGVPPYFRIYNRFLVATADWDPALHRFVLERLREYRRVLFGTRPSPPPLGAMRGTRGPPLPPLIGLATGSVCTCVHVLTPQKAGSNFRSQHHGADLNLSLRAPNKTG